MPIVALVSLASGRVSVFRAFRAAWIQHLPPALSRCRSADGELCSDRDRRNAAGESAEVTLVSSTTRAGSGYATALAVVGGQELRGGLRPGSGGRHAGTWVAEPQTTARGGNRES
jgi:hypothetical protein